MNLLRWFLDSLPVPRLWFDDVTRKEAIARLVNLPDADGERRAMRVVYAKPERDEIKPSCTHLYSDADELAEEIKRETAGQKVKPFKARGKQ